MILWLNEQAQSQQSFIQPLLCRRLPWRCFFTPTSMGSSRICLAQLSARIPALQQQSWCFGGDCQTPRQAGGARPEPRRGQTILGISVPLGSRQYPGWRCLYTRKDAFWTLSVIGGQTGHLRTKNLL